MVSRLRWWNICQSHLVAFGIIDTLKSLTLKVELLISV